MRALYDWTLRQAASRHAEPALGIVSFVESSFFPVPADALFLPMVLARPERAMRLALIATVGSVLGGIFGWIIGFYAFDMLARPVLEFYGKYADFLAMKARAGDGTILVMLVTSGLSHLPPIKVVTILSGVIGFDLKLFILSAIVARGGRFYLLAFLLRRYGSRVAQWVESRTFWIIAGGLMTVLTVWMVIKGV